jgi:hypothetical protein
MRIRSKHIVVLFLVLMGAVILVAVLRPSSADQKDSSDFIEQARLLRESGKGSPVGEGEAPAVSSDPTNVPKIEAETQEFHMGVIANDQKTTKQMMVFNRGKRDLLISAVKTSCGCTLGTFRSGQPNPAKPEDVVIAAGGRAPLSITVDPFRIPGFHAEKSLTIYSNDSTSPMLEIEVITDVAPEYDLDPPTLDFGSVDMGTPAEAHIRVRQASAKSIHIRGVEPTGRTAGRIAAGPGGTGEPEPFTVELHETPKDQWETPDRSEWDIAVRLAPTLPFGPFRGRFYIESDAKRIPKAVYSIQADVKSFFRVEPGILRVRDAAKPGQADVAIDTVIGEKPFEILDLEISGTDLRVQAKPGQDPNVTLINLSAAPNARPGMKTETISMKVKSGDKTVDYSTRVFVSVIAN